MGEGTLATTVRRFMRQISLCPSVSEFGSGVGTYLHAEWDRVPAQVELIVLTGEDPLCPGLLRNTGEETM